MEVLIYGMSIPVLITHKSKPFETATGKMPGAGTGPACPTLFSQTLQGGGCPSRLPSSALLDSHKLQPRQVLTKPSTKKSELGSEAAERGLSWANYSLYCHSREV